MVNVIYSLGTIWISDSPPNTTWDYWTPSRLIWSLLTNIFVLFGHLELNSFEILCFDTLRPPRPIHWILGIVSLKFEKVSNSKVNIFWNIFVTLCFSLLPFITPRPLVPFIGYWALCPPLVPKPCIGDIQVALTTTLAYILTIRYITLLQTYIF